MTYFSYGGLALLILCTGCGTTLKQRLAAWHGKEERELVQKLGVPDKKLALKDGSEVYEYVRRGSEVDYDRGTASVEHWECATIYTLGPDRRVAAATSRGCD